MNAQNRSGHRPDPPLVVFAGRSNVGKSSTIRALTGKNVRIGKSPGSTRWQIEIDMGPVIFVDIPGFGFMKGLSKSEIEATKTRIVRNLEEWSHRLVLAVLIVDISLFRELVERWDDRGEIPIDIEYYSFLSELASQVLVVANKADKLKKKETHREVDFLRQKLLEAVPSKDPQIMVTSASRKQGIDELRETIELLLKREKVSSPTW
jgi:GTP-binding protein EngB required for normal cell division